MAIIALFWIQLSINRLNYGKTSSFWNHIEKWSWVFDSQGHMEKVLIRKYSIPLISSQPTNWVMSLRRFRRQRTFPYAYYIHKHRCKKSPWENDTVKCIMYLVKLLIKFFIVNWKKNQPLLCIKVWEETINTKTTI